jgi:hypothetical protein
MKHILVKSSIDISRHAALKPPVNAEYNLLRGVWICRDSSVFVASGPKPRPSTKKFSSADTGEDHRR